MKDEYTPQDFAKAIKNPHVGKFIRNGKFTVVVEHSDHREVVEVAINRSENEEKASSKLLVV